MKTKAFGKLAAKMNMMCQMYMCYCDGHMLYLLCGRMCC